MISLSALLNGLRSVLTPTEIDTLQVSVGNTAAQLGSIKADRVIIKADPGNTDNVFIGNSGVTSSNGYLLGPGDSVELRIDDLSKVYAVSPTAGQTLYVIVLK